jgi:hypothetical protein
MSDQLVAEAVKHTTKEIGERVSLAGFEPTIQPLKRPQTYSLDPTATGIGAGTRVTLPYNFMTDTVAEFVRVAVHKRIQSLNFCKSNVEKTVRLFHAHVCDNHE